MISFLFLKYKLCMWSLREINTKMEVLMDQSGIKITLGNLPLKIGC